ncbi:peptide chain release factor H [Gottschalkia acidurici 9a]|uniref:Peptide chain release factor H n=1 Tax=Gottschalkia acidurici (strain ATCC 7906 / DSM 604 / BCRC 14475 / CIP 104303 / KCTC 5404 / NCIMB 10678 / 9a) TaxID=1128398 RepID=K0AXW8_GOTA9|nr:peptide chain release factor H [Gottschalkia acidurici]AFS77590.1 peptide chain release factor H [Gottschalkia acidurici 9a]
MWVQISAGLAPIECCRFAYKFLKYVEKECKSKKIKLELIDCIEDDKKETIKSVFLKLSGEHSKEYAKSIEGSIQWICKSEFRSNNKRKNWFIEVEIFDEEDSIDIDFKDIKIETMRCSGNGGQNVNKLETGVRVTHILTGITAIAQEERSQYQNKKLAISRLIKKIEALKAENDKNLDKIRWKKHKDIQRGNAVRTFKGKDFIEIGNKHG